MVGTASASAAASPGERSKDFMERFVYTPFGNAFPCYAAMAILSLVAGTVAQERPRVKLQGEGLHSSSLVITQAESVDTVPLGEVATDLELPEGEFKLSSTVSAAGGLPLVEYYCWCATTEENRAFSLTFDSEADTCILVITDPHTDRVWRHGLDRAACSSSSPQASDSSNWKVTKRFLVHKGRKYLLPEWMIEGDLKVRRDLQAQGAQIVLEWTCTPDIETKNYCLCDSTMPEDILRDNPTCVGYARFVKLMVHTEVEGQSLRIRMIEANFKLPSTLKNGVILNPEDQKN